MTDIAVISGSKSDSSVVEKVLRVLVEKGVDYDERILSAHRDPVALDRYIKETDAKIFIAVAGLSAALPGFIASRTDRPVIGVPVSAKLGPRRPPRHLPDAARGPRRLRGDRRGGERRPPGGEDIEGERSALGWKDPGGVIRCTRRS